MPTLEDLPYMTINQECLSKVLEPVKPMYVPGNTVEIFTNKELTRMMEMRHNIRSISVIGDVASGKSTLIDSLVVAAGVIHQEAGYFTDTRVDEIEQIMSIKSTGISRSYKMTNEALKALRVEHNGNEYLINLIDSPGHIDLSSEATAALHVTDGALLIVDSMEGVGLQTQSPISQIFRERVVPFLIINKIDDCFFELQVDGEKAYRSFQRVIQNVNENIVSRQDPLLGDVRIHTERGDGFHLGSTGGFYSNNICKNLRVQIRLQESLMMGVIWGDKFFNPNTKEWTNKKILSETCNTDYFILLRTH